MPPTKAAVPKAPDAECASCPLRGEQMVPSAPARSGKTRLVIVGEGPGRREIFEGKPFVGPSGRVLNQVLDETGISRADCFVTNAMLCACDDDDKDKKARATACCSKRLAREIAAVPGNPLIVAMGAYALKSTIGSMRILMSRGFVWHTPNVTTKLKTATRAAEKNFEKRFQLWHAQALAALTGRRVLPTVHPAFILRGADGWLPIFRRDMRRALELIENSALELADDWAYRTHKSVSRRFEVRDALAALGPTVSVDIETDGSGPLGANILCVGIADGKTAPVVIYPWRPKLHGPLLNEALRERTAVTHFGPQFDHIALEEQGVTFLNWDDTFTAYHTFMSHLPKRLDQVVSTYVTSAPWKLLSGRRGDATEKAIAPWEKGGVDLTKYCAADVHLTALSWERMQPDLEPERAVYEIDKRVTAMCKRMRQTGIRVDLEKRAALSASLKARKGALLGEMRALLRKKSFMPSRPQEVRDALFGKLKAVALRPTATGLPSTSTETLETLRVLPTRAGRLADLLLRWRAAGKARSTFVDGPTLDAFGRIHPGWKLGAVSGRLTCSPDSVMNLPRYGDDMTQQIRALYIPREGCSFVYFDLSQAEARAAAHISGDKNLIEACLSDIHTANARVIFIDPEALERLTRDPKGKKCKEHGDGSSGLPGCSCGKLMRDVAKNCGFCVWYEGSAERAFITLRAMGFDVDLEECEALVNKLHSQYRDYYRYVDANEALCRKQGYLRSVLLGRKRWFGYYPQRTEIANNPVQSFIADFMNERLPEIEERLPSGVRIVAQIHDAAIFEAPHKKVEAVKQIVRDTIAKPIWVPHNGLTFTMPCELKDGGRWSDF